MYHYETTEAPFGLLEAGMEQEVRRPGFTANINWLASRPISETPPKRGGVYIIARDKKPIYVGITDNFVERTTGRTAVLRVFGTDTSPFRIWYGYVKGGLPDPRETLFAVEHALIRTLLLFNFPLTNLKSIRQFLVSSPAAQPMHIERLLPAGIRVMLGAQLANARDSYRNKYTKLSPEQAASIDTALQRVADNNILHLDNGMAYELPMLACIARPLLLNSSMLEPGMHYHNTFRTRIQLPPYRQPVKYTHWHGTARPRRHR